MSAEAVKRAWLRWSAHYPREFSATSQVEVNARLASYIELLQDIPDQIMDVAALQVLALHDWFPTVHQVRDRGGALAHLMHGRKPIVQRECAAAIAQPSRRSAAEAWLVVQRTIKRDGARATFSDPIVRATVEVIGLARLRTDDNEAALFAQFRDTYDTLRARQREALITPGAVHQLLTQVRAHLQLESEKHDRQIPD